MTTPQRLPAALTSLDAALAALLDGLQPIEETFEQIRGALGRIAADDLTLEDEPRADIATADGFALAAGDLVGASAYTPVALAAPARWVEAGEPMPDGCDCVLDADLVDSTGPVVQALAEALPGQGVRRAGQDISTSTCVRAGRPLSPIDLFLGRMATHDEIAVRRPDLRVIKVPHSRFGGTAELVAHCAEEAGARVELLEAEARDAGSIGAAMDAAMARDASRPLVIVGGSGVGRTDATIEALATRGTVLAHGIALTPGRTSAIGRIGNAPVVVVPGGPQNALAAFWTIVQPMIDCLIGRERRQLTLPLAQKIASAIGIAELVLLEEVEAAWLPLAVGDLSLGHFGRADAWCVVPAHVEGHGAGERIGAHPIRDLR